MKWGILPNSSTVFDLLPGSIQNKIRPLFFPHGRLEVIMMDNCLQMPSLLF